MIWNPSNRLTAKRVKKVITLKNCLTAAIVYGPIGIFRCWSENSNASVTTKSAVPFPPASPPDTSLVFLLALISQRCWWHAFSAISHTLSTIQKRTASSLFSMVFGKTLTKIVYFTFVWVRLFAGLKNMVKNVVRDSKIKWSCMWFCLAKEYSLKSRYNDPNSHVCCPLNLNIKQPW